MHETPRLIDLATRHGVGTEYTDWRGNHVRVNDDTLIAVLAALDVDASTPEAIESALRDVEVRDWRRTLPPSLVLREGSGASVPVHVPHGTACRLDIVLETGEVLPAEQLDVWVDPREIEGVLTGRATFAMPEDLPLGWHELRATIGDGAALDSDTDSETPTRTATCALAVAPRRAPAHDGRVWGLMAQLYQVRSATSWGIGDLHDASSLARWGGQQGADFLLLNPLHAPAPVLPIEPSPYLPVTRRFVDPSVVSLDDEVALRQMPHDAAARVAALGQAAVQTNRHDTIDRDAVWRAKREALGLWFAADLADDGRRRAFGDFCEREGAPLVDFATYCALADEHGRDWGTWPEALGSPASPDVAAYRDANEERVEFYRWLQWIADAQLAYVQADALAAGMQIGIVHDLAVGVHPQGADAWAMPNTLARGVSVGAPPDAFNQLGQNWAQPPWRPDRLAEVGYTPFRDMLRAIFRHAGGVRIDHILGLFRLWWIPVGAGADRGAYVTYDAEAMLGVLLLEAHRANAIVIGEDLGVVAEHAREQLLERGVSGTSILWWEWDGDEPLAPDQYREACLAAVTTHDLPPTAGFLELAHVDLRERLGLLTRDVAEEREAEQASIDRILAAAEQHGAFDDVPLAEASTEERVVALHRYLAASSASLFGVAVADLAGDRRSVNQPGTYREYPNWSVPLAGPAGEIVSLEALLSSPFAARLAAAATRGRPPVTRAADDLV